MKKLLLIRHAEAINHAEAGDFARPLSENGLQGAAITSKNLHHQGYFPEMIVSSPAIRTTTTAQIIASHLQVSQTLFNQAIYDASERTLLKLINQFDDRYKFIALVGHNPGISYLLLNLTGEVRDVPPGTAILVTFDADEWAAIANDTGSIAYYTSPYC